MEELLQQLMGLAQNSKVSSLDMESLLAQGLQCLFISTIHLKEQEIIKQSLQVDQNSDCHKLLLMGPERCSDY